MQYIIQRTVLVFDPCLVTVEWRERASRAYKRQRKWKDKNEKFANAVQGTGQVTQTSLMHVPDVLLAVFFLGLTRCQSQSRPGGAIGQADTRL